MRLPALPLSMFALALAGCQAFAPAPDLATQPQPRWGAPMPTSTATAPTSSACSRSTAAR